MRRKRLTCCRMSLLSTRKSKDQYYSTNFLDFSRSAVWVLCHKYSKIQHFLILYYFFRYYMDKFGLDKNAVPPFITEIGFKYIEGLQWILRYYFQGVPSWSW